MEQLAQRCAWCNRYLMINQETAVYNGNNPLYQGWICHMDCNLEDVRLEDVRLEDAQLTIFSD